MSTNSVRIVFTLSLSNGNYVCMITGMNKAGEQKSAYTSKPSPKFDLDFLATSIVGIYSTAKKQNFISQGDNITLLIVNNTGDDSLYQNVLKMIREELYYHPKIFFNAYVHMISFTDLNAFRLIGLTEELMGRKMQTAYLAFFNKRKEQPLALFMKKDEDIMFFSLTLPGRVSIKIQESGECYLVLSLPIVGEWADIIQDAFKIE